jgi:hypothetical protein
MTNTFITYLKGVKKARRKKHYTEISERLFKLRWDVLRTCLHFGLGKIPREEFLETIEVLSLRLAKRETYFNSIRKYIG